MIRKIAPSYGTYTKLTPFVARGPCASQGSLDQKTSNHVNWVLITERNFVLHRGRLKKKVKEEVW